MLGQHDETDIGNLEPQYNGTVGMNYKKIQKNNVKKQQELKAAALKEYEEWHSKVTDYVKHTGISECKEKNQADDNLVLSINQYP